MYLNIIKKMTILLYNTSMITNIQKLLDVLKQNDCLYDMSIDECVEYLNEPRHMLRLLTDIKWMSMVFKLSSAVYKIYTWNKEFNLWLPCTSYSSIDSKERWSINANIEFTGKKEKHIIKFRISYTIDKLGNLKRKIIYNDQKNILDIESKHTNIIIDSLDFDSDIVSEMFSYMEIKRKSALF